VSLCVTRDSRSHAIIVGRLGIMGYELAQVNVARLRAPLDDPLLSDFVANLEPVNSTAEQADGFVWRLRDGDDATSIQVFDDPWLIVNMSVWRSPEHLLAFVYGAGHRTQLRRRREWFTQLRCGGCRPVTVRPCPRPKTDSPRCARTARPPRRSPFGSSSLPNPCCPTPLRNQRARTLDRHRGRVELGLPVSRRQWELRMGAGASDLEVEFAFECSGKAVQKWQGRGDRLL
jgi:hypothetical protein